VGQGGLIAAVRAAPLRWRLIIDALRPSAGVEALECSAGDTRKARLVARSYSSETRASRALLAPYVQNAPCWAPRTIHDSAWRDRDEEKAYSSPSLSLGMVER